MDTDGGESPFGGEGGEGALATGENLYQVFLQRLPDAIVVYDTVGKAVYVNPAFEETFGWSGEELMGGRVDFVPPEARAETAEKIKCLMRGEAVKAFETKRLTKDGRGLDIQLNTSPFFDQKGRLLGNIVVLRDVSELRRAQDRLAESEERHRILLERSPDATIVYDMRGKAIFVNPAFEKTFGWSREELLGGRVDFVPPEAQAETAEKIKCLVRGEAVEAFETKRLTKDGRKLDIQLSTSPFHGRDGKLLGNIVVMRDVTESEKRFRQLIERSPLGVAIIGDMGRYEYVNPRFVEMLGYSLADTTDQEAFLRQLYPDPEYRKQVAEDWAALLTASENGEIRHHTFTVFCKDGWTKHVHLRSVALAGGDNLLIYEDITERKRMEDEREKLVQQLQEALAQVKNLQGLLPICANCKKIRDDQGAWTQIERYIAERSEAQFTHGICPECKKILYPQLSRDD